MSRAITDKPLIGFGQVRHTRLHPKKNAFTYSTFFLLLPMRQLRRQGSESLPLNKWGAVSFYDADHGDGRSVEQGGALGWIEELLLQEGVFNADGEIWLSCYPRIWGHTFKPVSFWYCHSKDGRLSAIVVEVNNTFGERHCYLLEHPRQGITMAVKKLFHVSPFFPVQGSYQFRFIWRPDLNRTIACIDLIYNGLTQLKTSLSGNLQPLTSRSLRFATWRYPLMTLFVVFRIHLQAIYLYFKKIPFFKKPPAPSTFISR